MTEKELTMREAVEQDRLDDLKAELPDESPKGMGDKKDRIGVMLGLELIGLEKVVIDQSDNPDEVSDLLDYMKVLLRRSFEWDHDVDLSPDGIDRDTVSQEDR